MEQLYINNVFHDVGADDIPSDNLPKSGMFRIPPMSLTIYERKNKKYVKQHSI